jgi:hypothetical protein
MRLRAALFYIAAKMVGAVAGVWLAHLMFSLPILQTSAHARTSAGELVGEFVATFARSWQPWACLSHATPTCPPRILEHSLLGPQGWRDLQPLPEPAGTLLARPPFAIGTSVASRCDSGEPHLIASHLAGSLPPERSITGGTARVTLGLAKV